MDGTIAYALLNPRIRDLENGMENDYYGVKFSGSASAGTRTGRAVGLTFTAGTDAINPANDFDGVYPWAGMVRCCCTLNADGTVTPNTFAGQPGYAEDGSVGEVLVRVPKFYVAGKIDADPRISMYHLHGYRCPKKFLASDGTEKDYAYYPAFACSIGTDGKLHSVAEAVPAMNINIVNSLAKARLWGDTYGIETTWDDEVLMYLMVVATATRNLQSIFNGVCSLYKTNASTVSVAQESAASVIIPTTSASLFAVGQIIGVGTGNENMSAAAYRIITDITSYDASNTTLALSGETFSSATDNNIWRIIQSTGTANSVQATCGSPASNSDGLHSFVFYGIENPLYGNQWRPVSNVKMVDGVYYTTGNPAAISWTSMDGYDALNIAVPAEGYAISFGQDARHPDAVLTDAVGGSSGTYLADYFWRNVSGVRVCLRGGSSGNGSNGGPFSVNFAYDAGYAWWFISPALSIPG